jgi:hypothetical protein
MNDLPLTGGCNCRAVRFEVTEPLVVASYCHCKRCQRRSGAAASANAHPAPGAFAIVAGEDRLRVWRPDDGGDKWFCGDCGSSLFGRNASHADPIGIRMGASTTIRESGRASDSSWPTLPRGSRSPTTDCLATPRVATSRVDAAMRACHSQRPGLRPCQSSRRLEPRASHSRATEQSPSRRLAAPRAHAPMRENCEDVQRLTKSNRCQAPLSLSSEGAAGR